VTYRFTFTYEDKTYAYGSLKVREIEALEDLLDCRYVEIAPFTTMRHKLAIMAVFLKRDHTDDEVATLIEGMDLDAVQGMWDVVEDDLPSEYEDGIPLAEADTSTPTK
jgi:hypothetical protein